MITTPLAYFLYIATIATASAIWWVYKCREDIKKSGWKKGFLLGDSWSWWISKHIAASVLGTTLGMWIVREMLK